MWKLTSIFIFLSLAVGIWLISELTGLSSGAVMASEKGDVAVSSAETLQESNQEKNKLIAKRESELEKRELGVSEKERVLASQIDRYEQVIHDLKSKLNETSAVENSRVDTFRHIYEKMDPKKASNVLSEMDLGVAAQIIGGMKQDRAAEILNHMGQEKARLITEKFLGKPIRSSTPKVNEANAGSP
jgi:flagellar motility protein MotE (MotC chaperone)